MISTLLHYITENKLEEDYVKWFENARDRMNRAHMPFEDIDEKDCRCFRCNPTKAELEMREKHQNYPWEVIGENEGAPFEVEDSSGDTKI